MERSNWYHVKHILKQTWEHPSNADHRLRSIGSTLTWQFAKRTLKKPKIVPFFGFQLKCYPDSQSASNVIYFTERYDIDEMGFIEAFLRPGDGFVDVGANIGSYSLFARSLVGPEGHIDGFEPHPVAARRFRENVELNALNNITVHEAAVGSENGEVELLDGADVSNRVLSENPSGRRTVAVPVVTLDSALSGRSFAMGKVDVEGFETALFRGALERLDAADPPVWQIEMLDHQLKRAGTSRPELVGILVDHGFRLAEMDGPPSKAGQVRLRWSDPEGKSTFNLWAIHSSAVELVEERLGTKIL